jgi:hypothetical protein
MSWHVAPINVARFIVPAGHIPTLAEGMAKIAHLAAHGPSAEAFTFQAIAPPPPTSVG